MFLVFLFTAFLLQKTSCIASNLPGPSITSQSFIGWMRKMSPSFNQVSPEPGLFKEYTHCFDGRFISIDCVDWFQNESLIRSTFYKYLSLTQKGTCLVGKIFGGRRWKKSGGSSDGEKFICLDNLIRDILNKTCLVYSFGIGDDWTFEESMAELGCKIRAFDPNDGVKKSGSIAITYSKIALYSEISSNLSIGDTENLDGIRLVDAVERLKDSRNRINILKIDVEGEEFFSIPQILHSKILKQVDQIHIEVHTDEVFSPWKAHSHIYMSRLFDNFIELSSAFEYRYKNIHYGPNLNLERKASKSRKFFSYFDIVLYKPH